MKVKIRQAMEHLLNTGNYQNTKLVSEITLEGESNDGTIEELEDFVEGLQAEGRIMLFKDIKEQKQALDNASEDLFALSS